MNPRHAAPQHKAHKKRCQLAGQNSPVKHKMVRAMRTHVKTLDFRLADGHRPVAEVHGYIFFRDERSSVVGQFAY
jgi:alanyl-tRNA synthetase